MLHCKVVCAQDRSSTYNGKTTLFVLFYRYTSKPDIWLGSYGVGINRELEMSSFFLFSTTIGARECIFEAC